jgi:hypothetical protein
MWNYQGSGVRGRPKAAPLQNQGRNQFPDSANGITAAVVRDRRKGTSTRDDLRCPWGVHAGGCR